MIRSLLSALILIAAPAGASFAADWKLAKYEDGVRVERRAVEGSPIDEVRGSVEVAASLREATLLFEDVDSYTDWFDRCAEANELHRVENVSSDVYLRFDMPWPLSDRDVAIHVDRVEYGEQRAVYEGRNQPDLAEERDGVVRMPELRTRWVLEALPNGTRVTMNQHGDPGGRIPKWAVNLVTVDIPFNTLRGFRDRLE